MSDLRKLRLKIDEIDKDVVKLLLKRLDLSRQIGEYKLRENKDILDIQREKSKLDTDINEDNKIEVKLVGI